MSSTAIVPTPAEWEAHQAFYRLTVKERDYERARVDRLTRENTSLREALQDLVSSVEPLVETESLARARRVLNGRTGTGS